MVRYIERLLAFLRFVFKMITPSYSATATERVLPRMALDFTTASLDSRVTVTRALNTATAVNSSGFIAVVNANLPRFDYNPVTLACKGLLIEEARTNILTYSAQLENAAWTRLNATVTADAAVSPDGGTNADKLIGTAGLANIAVFQSPALTASTAYTETVYAKKAEWSWVALEIRGESADAIQAWFNLNTGAVGTIVGAGTATITDAGNGWYRCSLTRTMGATTTSPRVRIYPTNANTLFSTGDGTSGIFAWGAQLEAGAFATSYIPTTTTSLTRNADVVSMTGTNFSDWYNASEGTFVASGYSVYSVVGANPLIYASDGTENNYLRLLANNVSSSTVNVSGVAQANFSFGSPTVNSAINDYVLAYKLNSFCAAYNSSTGTDVSGTLPVVDRLQIGQRASGTLMSGTIKRIYYYNIRLTNNECLTLSQRSIRGA